MAPPNVQALPGQDPIVVKQLDRLIIVEFHGEATDERYAAYLAQMSDIMYKGFDGRKKVVINDATRWAKSSARQRQIQAEWMKAHAERMRATTAGVGFVFSSAIIRGGLTAVLWFQPLPVPHKIFKTVEAATAWGRDVLFQGIDPSAEARDEDRDAGTG